MKELFLCGLPSHPIPGSKLFRQQRNKQNPLRKSRRENMLCECFVSESTKSCHVHTADRNSAYKDTRARSRTG